MGLFPLVQSPCPYKGPLKDILDGSICRLCDREVHDISALSEAERIELVSGCTDEICVTYKVSKRSAIAALALGAAASAMPVAAYAQTAGTESGPQQATAAPPEELMEIIVGRLRAPRKARWASDRPVAKGRELPVVFEPGQPHEADTATNSPNEEKKRT